LPFFFCLAAAAAATAACGADGGTEPGKQAPAPAVSASAPAELGTLKEAGFGQRGEYVWVTAVVHNNSKYVGQTVTVNFNVLDAGGQILKSASQVESFSQPQADHILGTQVDLASGEKAAKVEATLDVEAAGAFSDQPFPAMPTLQVSMTKDYGSVEASFVLSNPLAQPVKSPRIDVICRDAANKIVGGGSDYPELVPAGGKSKVDARVIVSSSPKTCSVFVGAPADWEGVATATAAPSPAAPRGTAEAAFKTWVQQFGKKEWKAQYQTLVTAQKKVVSQASYIRCRSSEATPEISWVKALSTVDAGKSPIPGTKVSMPATVVKAQVSSEGLKVPVDAHMFQEDGIWKWSMTQENISNCRD
jgi:hypothetical protein